MMALGTRYHTQRNNKLFPYSTCGTTVIAEYLSWLNIKYGKDFISDDDAVFEALNCPKMLDKALAYIQQGEDYIKGLLKHRVDEPNTPLDESKYNYLNQSMLMLCKVAEYLTNYTFDFKMNYRNEASIKQSIDDGFPVIIAGKFTESGHFVLIVGYDENGNWIVDDPYGNWNSRYKDENGSRVSYTIEAVNSIVNLKEDRKLLSIRGFII
jgi:hypothetical protein